MATSQHSPEDFMSWSDRVRTRSARQDDQRTDGLLDNVHPEVARKVSEELAERDKEREREARKAKAQEQIRETIRELEEAREIARKVIPESQRKELSLTSPRETHLAVIKYLAPSLVPTSLKSDAFVAGLFKGLVADKLKELEENEAAPAPAAPRTDSTECFAARLERARAGSREPRGGQGSAPETKRRADGAGLTFAQRLERARTRGEA